MDAQDQISDSNFDPSSHLKEGQKYSGLVIRNEKVRIGWSLLVPTLALVLLSAGLSTFLLCWLAVIKHVDGTSIAQYGGFIVSEGTTTNSDGTKSARLVGLTISTVTVRSNMLSVAPLLTFCRLKSLL
jgi:hypothetical protein